MRFLLPALTLLVCAFSSLRAEEIPFNFVDGYILVHACVNAQPVTLVLDSGASASVLSLDAARRLKIALGKPQPVDGVDAGATAYHIKPLTPKSGQFSLGAFEFAIDLQSAAKLCSEPVDGLIGVNFFRNRVTQIDYAHQRLRFLDAAPAGGEFLPLKAKNGVFCLPLSVNGSKPRWTRLDTGCNDALHWVAPRIASRDQPRGVSIGFITNTDDETLVTVKLGQMTLPHVEAALHGSAIFPGEAGLLGSEVLSQFLVTVDAREGRIWFKPASR